MHSSVIIKAILISLLQAGDRLRNETGRRRITRQGLPSP
ncbi:hypothetical protein C7S15_3755 [Burkholderia cepacia]|nr:hypothetical protein [Burkholderia cepacia]